MHLLLLLSLILLMSLTLSLQFIAHCVASIYISRQTARLPYALFHKPLVLIDFVFPIHKQDIAINVQTHITPLSPSFAIDLIFHFPSFYVELVVMFGVLRSTILSGEIWSVLCKRCDLPIVFLTFGLFSKIKEGPLKFRVFLVEFEIYAQLDKSHNVCRAHLIIAWSQLWILGFLSEGDALAKFSRGKFRQWWFVGNVTCISSSS